MQCSSLGVKSSHLESTDNESSFVDRIDNLSSVSVDIGLDHSKGRLFALCKVLSSEHITIVNELKLASENSNGGSNEQILSVDLGAGLSLEEQSLVLAVEHLNSAGERKVEKSIISDNISLLVVPLGFIVSTETFCHDGQIKSDAIHEGFGCDGCAQSPIKGNRYTCKEREGFNYSEAIRC